MKRIALSFMILFLALAVKGQPPVPIEDGTGRVVYTEVVTVAGASQAELYKRLDRWFNTFYKNAGSIIQSQDAAAGKIEGKHTFYIYNEVNGKKNQYGQVKYTITVEAKEGKYRYKLDDIYYFQVPKLYVEKWLDPAAPNKTVQFGYLQQVHDYMTDLTTKLKEGMAKPVPASGGSDW
ncbi:hypothetical protein BH09BAC1_BH09BAC1_20220 [soil metagenome]